MFAVNCSDVMLLRAINGHPQVGALRNLEKCRAPRNDSMVHVIQLQQWNRIRSGQCSYTPFALKMEFRCYDFRGFDSCFRASFHG